MKHVFHDLGNACRRAIETYQAGKLTDTGCVGFQFDGDEPRLLFTDHVMQNVTPIAYGEDLRTLVEYAASKPGEELPELVQLFAMMLPGKVKQAKGRSDAHADFSAGITQLSVYGFLRALSDYAKTGAFPLTGSGSARANHS